MKETKTSVGTKTEPSTTAVSTASCPLTIVDAVRFADNVLGEGREWSAVNPEQAWFIRDYLNPFGQLTGGLKEIESIAAHDAGLINEFLRQHDFTIQLEEFSPEEFGVASVLDLLVEWQDVGKVITITTPDQRTFEGAEIIKHGVTFFRVLDHPNPIACLNTKSTDLVYMTMLDNPLSEFELVTKAQEFMAAMKHMTDFEGLQFPMVNLRQQVDISWLLKMHTKDDKGFPWFISQALQENHLRMNEKGARAQSATAVGMMRMGIEIPKPKHIINQPFLVWFSRPGLDIPLFVGHVTEADWENPGDITTT